MEPKQAHALCICRRLERLTLARQPTDLFERVDRVVREYVDTDRRLVKLLPALYMDEYHIDLTGLHVSPQWIATIVQYFSKDTHDIQLTLAETPVNDTCISHLQVLRNITILQIPRCKALTDASLDVVGNYLHLLEELNIDDSRHFTPEALMRVWKSCRRLHSLSANNTTAITDTFLEFISTCPRSSAQHAVRKLHLERCRKLTSAGIAQLTPTSRSIADISLQDLRLGECLELTSMAFFNFEKSRSVRCIVKLNLRALPVDEAVTSWIAKGCPNLRQLILSHCSQLSDFALFQLAPCMFKLVKLDLDACIHVTSIGIQNLFAQEPRNDQVEDDGFPLQTLNLQRCKLENDALVAIGKHCPNLIKLDVSGIRVISDTGVIAVAKGCRKLKDIKMSGKKVSGQAFQALRDNCAELQLLDIAGHNELDSPHDLLQLVQHQKSVLKSINLSNSNICDAGVYAIASNCPQLNAINLSKCARVTDAAIESLAGFCFSLQTLLLSNTKSISDRSLIACAIAQLPLHTIDLSCNVQITRLGLETLCGGCQWLQSVKLNGCERLSLDMLIPCYRTMLPFTREPVYEKSSLVSQLKLVSLPVRQVQSVRRKLQRHENAAYLQAWFRRWKNRQAMLRQIVRRRVQRYRRAAQRIQKSARKFVQWRKFMRFLCIETNLQQVVYAQACVRGNQSRYRTRIVRFVKRRAVRYIQDWFLPHYLGLLDTRWKAAIVIQSFGRKLPAKARLAQLQHERRIMAVDKIWHWYRKCLNNYCVRTRSRWLLLKIRCIQGQWRAHRCRKNFKTYMKHYHSCATKIQAEWKRVLAMRYLRRLRPELMAASTELQRVGRGMVSRLNTREHKWFVYTCCAIIQATWKMYVDYFRYQRDRRYIILAQRMAKYARTVRRFRRVVISALLDHRDKHARILQRYVRGHFGRCQGRLRRKLRNVRRKEREMQFRQACFYQKMMEVGAASRLQKWVMPIIRQIQFERLQRWREYVASILLQRSLRQWMCRLKAYRRYQQRSRACTEIQRCYRGLLGRRKYAEAYQLMLSTLKARLMQRLYRGYCGRKLFYRTKVLYNSSAARIQGVFRTRKSTILFEIARAATALKAREMYQRSAVGRIDLMTNPIDELYRRARLFHERDALEALKKKWKANEVAGQRAIRKHRRDHDFIWEEVSNVIATYWDERRKLYGVSETVYGSNQESNDKREEYARVQVEVVRLREKIQCFRTALEEASTTRRILDRADVLDLLRQYDLVG